jgi:hypothetical protein
MTKREAFAVAMTMLSETFNRPLTDAMLDGYWLVLEDLSEVEMRASARAALATGKFMPSPAELLGFARPARSKAADPVLAWQAVRKAIDKYDYLVGSIDFGPLVNAVIRNLGGWDTMCKATLPELDNPGWLRKRFEDVYRALAAAEPTTLHGDALEGALPPNYQNPIHAVVAIDGKVPAPRLEANGASDARASIAATIRGLADGKSE